MLEKLSNKVVYDFKSSKYVGVFATRYLRSWTKSVKEISKVKKIKIPKAIHDLITFQRRETLVIYQDGTCESLQTCIESRKYEKNMPGQEKPIINAETQRITKVAYFTSPLSESTLLTYFVVTNDRPSEPIEFVYFNLDASNLAPSGPINRFRIQRGASQDAQLVGCTVVDGDLYPSLISICKYEAYFFFSKLLHLFFPRI